jgi:hypothetical protein
LNKINITLVAALIAAFAGIGNVYFGHLSSTSLEQQRWEKERQDESRKNLTLAFAEFSQELATGVQKATWLLWIADFSPALFSEKDLEIYNQEIKIVLPKLLAARVKLAAHDYSIYQKVSRITQDFYSLDANIALTELKFKKSKEIGLREFQELSKQAQKLHGRLPSVLASIIGATSIEGRK